MDNESLVSSPSCVLVDDLSVTHLESFIDATQDSFLSPEESFINITLTRDDSLVQQVTRFFHRDSLSQLDAMPNAVQKMGKEPPERVSVSRRSLSGVSNSSNGRVAYGSDHMGTASKSGWDSKRCSYCDTTHGVVDNSSYRKTLPTPQKSFKARSRIPRFRSDLLDNPPFPLPRVQVMETRGSNIPTFSKKFEWELLRRSERNKTI